MNKYSVCSDLSRLVQSAFPDAADLNEIQDKLMPFINSAVEVERAGLRECVEDLLRNVSEHCPLSYIQSAEKLLEETKP